jgi:glycosyltransferase involved in cell wall biosynthesis
MYIQAVDQSTADRQQNCDRPPLGDRSSALSSSPHRILLFDLSVHGHHPAYVQHLIHHWQTQTLSGSLDSGTLNSAELAIVVSPKFLDYHADVVKKAAQKTPNTISFLAITPEADAALKPRKSGWSRMQRAFQEWHILCDYARELKATQCLVMYFDTYQLPLAIGEKPPCPVSGIYFKPTFHYSNFCASSPTWKERLQHWREQRLLVQVVQQPALKTLFCLDPFVVEPIDRLCPRKAVSLPDPVQVTPVAPAQVAELRSRLRIEPGRKICLLFGTLNGRKGTYQLLDAIALLPPELAKTLCVLLVGQANSQDQTRTLAQAATLSRESSAQLIIHHEFVPESDVQTYFHLADLVLAPYQNHAGMSGILIWAAVAQKPVLSSDYGLMGELVRRYQLGLTVDSTQPTEIAKGLAQVFQDAPKDLDPLEGIGDRALMTIFAEQNSAGKFAHTIFQTLLGTEV